MCCSVFESATSLREWDVLKDTLGSTRRMLLVYVYFVVSYIYVYIAVCILVCAAMCVDLRSLGFAGRHIHVYTLHCVL